jgi:hypothetical protein
MTRRAAIGFDRRIDLEWLDAAAAQAATGASGTELRAYLGNLLDDLVSGDIARRKTVTVLNHIWGDVPPAAGGLRKRVLSRLADATAEERLALHWAMMLATYPVFTDVAASAGRLLTLQGSFSLAQLTRRLVGSWGERSTLTRAAQRIMRSMIQWGVLRDTDTRGIYEAVPGARGIGQGMGALLVEALLIDAEASSVPFNQLVRHPALFPFEVALNSGDLRSAAQFQVHRQGLDSDFIELRGGV